MWTSDSNETVVENTIEYAKLHGVNAQVKVVTADREINPHMKRLGVFVRKFEIEPALDCSTRDCPNRASTWTSFIIISSNLPKKIL